MSINNRKNEIIRGQANHDEQAYFGCFHNRYSSCCQCGYRVDRAQVGDLRKFEMRQGRKISSVKTPRAGDLLCHYLDHIPTFPIRN